MKTLLRWILPILVLAGSIQAQEPVVPVSKKPLVYVLPIRNAIEPALLYVLRRGAAEADAAQADAIIFVMDTPGGTVAAARDIVFMIQNLRIPAYTFVEKDAFSAGAIIALATRGIYMAPGSVIGDAMPILMTPFGGIQEMPEAVQEKMVSGVAALIRAAAEQGGHNKELAEAMVRRDSEFKIGDRVIKPEGRLLTLTNEEAEEPIGENGQPLLSAGTVRSVEELLERIGLPNAELRELRITSAERIARVLAALGPLLLMAGLLGIYIEVRTPGFGLPGILGILALGLFFWGHHIAGLTGSEDVLLFLVGVALLAVELLFLPGFGLVGIGGILLMAAGLLMAMVYRAPGGPIIPAWPQVELPLFHLSVAVVGAAFFGALAGRFLPKSRLFRRLVLETATDRASGYSAAEDRSALSGVRGRAATDLRPAGSALLGGRRIDVITRGEFIAEGVAIRVAETHGARVVVERDPEAREV
ncbi:MAG: NfeD family protein [Kiritimatiellia bacterium]|nr:NfeD family protein [Kiritimatiellia bacterium]